MECTLDQPYNYTTSCECGKCELSESFPLFPPPLTARIARPNLAIKFDMICGFDSETVGGITYFHVWVHRATNTFSKAVVWLILIILTSCHPSDPTPSCPLKNSRNMDLIGIDKCGCLYAVPACFGNSDCMYTTDRKPCL